MNFFFKFLLINVFMLTVMTILYKIDYCIFFDFRDPNSDEIRFTWVQATADKPCYLSLNGGKSVMVEEKLNHDRTEFWKTLSTKPKQP